MGSGSRDFTRIINGRRQRSRRFPVFSLACSTLSPSDHVIASSSCQLLSKSSFTHHSPISGRRIRSKRRRKTIPPLACNVELSAVAQLLPAEFVTLPSPPCTEPELLNPESIVPPSFDITPLLAASPEALVASPEASARSSAHRPPLVHAPLPYAHQFLPELLPPLRPNTEPRANRAPANGSSLARVHSRLKRDAWEFFLRDYADRTFVDTLLHIIDHGADIGFRGPRDISYTAPNLSSASEHPEVIGPDIHRQVLNARTRGPFESPPLPHFRSSPLGVASRKRSSKLRRIHHLSWPRGSSVNDGIADEEATISYETFTDAAHDIIASGPGSWLVKLDLEQAFRQIPVRPEDWPLLGFSWQDRFYHELALTFGIRSAPYIFNLFSEALHWILQRHLPARIRHLLDDFLEIFTPSTPLATVQHALDWSLALGSTLGLGFQMTKIEGPATALDFLGITLDTCTMEARLPPDKLVYLTELLSKWMARRRCSLRDLQELTGYLQFCAQVIPYARAFIRSLFDFSSTFSSPFQLRHLPRAAHRDISWWSTFASAWNGVHLLSPSRETVRIYTDASGTKGAGGIFGSRWFAARIPRRYIRANRDIKFKEFYAIIYAILCWGPLLTGKHIIFYIDNQNVVSALSNLSSTSAPIMMLLRQFLNLACRLNFTFEPRWIPTAENSLADAASRFQYTRLFSLAPYLDQKPSPKILRVFGGASSPSSRRPDLTLSTA